MNPNSSVMDSSKHGMSKSEFVDDQQSVATGQNEYRVSITKIKNVFNLLIEETPFLLDDKTIQECEGKTLKEEFAIKIDAIRKSLGIDHMDDVELLVLTFYEYSDRHKQEQRIAEEGEPESNLNKDLTSKNGKKQ